MKNKIAAAALTLALALPATSALADDARTRGTLIGAVAGALVTQSVRGAVIGAALGNGVAYVNHERRYDGVYYYPAVRSDYYYDRDYYRDRSYYHRDRDRDRDHRGDRDRDRDRR
jgi:hypothetical protein